MKPTATQARTTTPKTIQPVRLPVLTPALLIGADGLLGRAWLDLLLRHPQLAHPDNAWPSPKQLDLTAPRTLDTWLTNRYRTVINCAAYTDVDAAQDNPQLADQLNHHAPAQLAQRCAKTGATLLHYSTDYVFDGRTHTPYAPHHPTNPLSVYGRTKADGERAIQQTSCRSLIVRSSWLHAGWGQNFVRTIAKLAPTRSMLRVVDDQVGRPTHAPTLAANSLALLTHQATGIYHLADAGQCSWYQLACQIIGWLRCPCRVEPCSTDQYPLPAPRPGFSVLDLTQSQQLLGPLPHWQTTLHQTLTALQNNPAVIPSQASAKV